MVANQKFDDRRLLCGDPEAFAGLPSHPRPDFAVVARIALAQVVHQGGQQQRPGPAHPEPNPPQPVIALSQGQAPFQCQDRVLVDCVFVIVVELQEIAGVGKAGNKSLEPAGLMEAVKQVGEPRSPLQLGNWRGRQQPDEGLDRVGGRRWRRAGSLVVVCRGAARGRGSHSLPGGGVDR